MRCTFDKKRVNMNSEQIERIKNMENNLETARKAVKDLNASIERYLMAQASIKELSEYYSSKEWLNDYDADCHGELPKGLKRGVLSQDAVYNLLCENDETVKNIQKIINISKHTYGKDKD